MLCIDIQYVMYACTELVLIITTTYVHMYEIQCLYITTLNVTVSVKNRLVCTCQYFEKYHLKIQLKDQPCFGIGLITEHNNT